MGTNYAHTSLRNSDIKLQEFTLNSLASTLSIFATHIPLQIHSQGCRSRHPAYSAPLPSPCSFMAGALPPHVPLSQPRRPCCSPECLTSVLLGCLYTHSHFTLLSRVTCLFTLPFLGHSSHKHSTPITLITPPHASLFMVLITIYISLFISLPFIFCLPLVLLNGNNPFPDPVLGVAQSRK